MALNITTNTAALRAGEILSKNQRLLEKSFGRLSSGKKINSRLMIQAVLPLA